MKFSEKGLPFSYPHYHLPKQTACQFLSVDFVFEKQWQLRENLKIVLKICFAITVLKQIKVVGNSRGVFEQ